MPTAPNLPTDVAPGDPGHATLHNDVNTSVNELAGLSATVVDIQTGSGSFWLTRQGSMVTMWASGDLTVPTQLLGPIPLGWRPLPDTAIPVPWVDDGGALAAVGNLNGDNGNPLSDYMLDAGGVADFIFFRTFAVTYPTADPAPA